MNIAIVEDLDIDYDLLKDILLCNKELNEYNIDIQRYTDGESFINDFSSANFNIVFLDIALNGDMNGMDVARQVRKKGSSIPIVFTTGEQQYALESYEVHAYDYLLKPYSAERAGEVLKRFVQTNNLKKYIPIKVERKCINIAADDIIWAESNNHALEIHLNNKPEVRTYISFKDFSELVENDNNFCCSSRGVIVNINYVDYISNGDLFLTTGKVLPVSRSRKSEVNKAFNDCVIRKTRRR